MNTVLVSSTLIGLVAMDIIDGKLYHKRDKAPSLQSEGVKPNEYRKMNKNQTRTN